MHEVRLCSLLALTMNSETSEQTLANEPDDVPLMQVDGGVTLTMNSDSDTSDDTLENAPAAVAMVQVEEVLNSSRDTSLTVLPRNIFSRLGDYDDAWAKKWFNFYAVFDKYQRDVNGKHVCIKP